MTDPFDAQAFLRNCSRRPGVYRMYAADERLLYVGKANDLRQRLSSYFRKSGLAPKTAALVERIRHIETTITGNETEALLLEQSLIKQHRPPYNILLRDDKSYPYILLSAGEYPRLTFHRGRSRRKFPGRYFGPYPGSGAIRETLNLLQKAFGVRQCEDSYFRARQRPCLQYQIQRCKAPCVGLISSEDYARDVRHSVMFLEGRSSDLLQELSAAMEAAAEQLDFERAAQLRDKLALLRRIQEQQGVEGQSGHADVIAVHVEPGGACIHLLTVRDGRVLGSRSFFPQCGIEASESAVMSAFLAQYYLQDRDMDWPGEILLNVAPEDAPTLIDAIRTLKGRIIPLRDNVRGVRARWQKLAQTNARQGLAERLASRQQLQTRFVQLQDALQLAQLPKRIECFDISHTSGEATIASCVAFGLEGPLRSDYRRYGIEGIAPGDDYAAMRQALERRFREGGSAGPRPDILLIDGGKGQLKMALEVMQALAVQDIVVMGVAKGTTRKPGFETLYLNSPDREQVLSADSPALHLIQQVRDEAHRFAITGHRARRARARTTSALEEVPGIGPKRRRELLRHFGGLQELRRASMEDIARVPGINQKLAEQVYAALHAE